MSRRRRKTNRRKTTDRPKEGRRLVEDTQRESVQTKKAEPYRPEPVPEESVPKEALTGRDFRPAGQVCKTCGWRTRKTGFNARQAVRAHLKVHSNERRAYRRPIKWQLGILAAIMSALTAAFVYQKTVRPGTVIDLDGVEIITAVALTTASVAVGLFLLRALVSAGTTYSWIAIRTARWLNGAATLIVSAAGGVWLLGSPAMPWWGLVAPLFLMMLTVFVAGEIGSAAHAARRRKWRSPRYSGLVKPSGEEAEDRYDEWRSRLISQVRRGRVDVRKLRGAARVVAQSWLRSRVRIANRRRARNRQRTDGR